MTLALPEGAKQVSLTVDKLKEYWDHLKGHNSIFLADGKLTEEKFVEILLSDAAIIEIEGGLVLLTNIYPGVRAEVHLAIWDRNLQNKVQLLKDLIVWGFLYFDLRRVETFIPVYARMVRQVIEKHLNFRYEGKLRQRSSLHGKAVDQLVYAILREEALP